MNEGKPAAPRVALVHDWLNQYGGAENVLEELAALFPGAPVYTSIYAPERMPPAYRSWPIHTSFLQRLPGITTHHQPYLPLYPLAFGRMDLSGYDLVVSNKSAFCHGIYTGEPPHKRTRHVCYCLTPTRFLWLYEQYREREQIGRLQDRALRPVLAALRQWDWDAAQRVDHFIAISRVVQERIRAIYGRESIIIYPPVDTDYFTPAEDAHTAADADLPRDYYLIVSRLIPYKRIDLAVAAMQRLPAERLVVVGEGRDLAPLRAAASPNVHFLGRQSRERVRELLQGCKAFLFPGLEDFGIAPLQAMAVGRPVIAFADGGALDTMVPGVTGELFTEQTVDSLLDVLSRFNPAMYDPAACRAQAERFSTGVFREQLRDYLAQVCSAGLMETAAMPEASPAGSAAQSALKRVTG